MGIAGRAAIPPGNYWYDNISGLWGNKGGPKLGQMLPGLDLGGRLKADASNGNTSVFISGREIHGQELACLQGLFGCVKPGRYWLNGYGIGGLEGGPPVFNLYAAGAGGGGGSGGYGGYKRRTLFGSIGGDGNCSYFMSPGGNSVMSCD